MFSFPDLSMSDDITLPSSAAVGFAVTEAKVEEENKDEGRRMNDER